MAVVVGIDLGTTGTKVALFDPDRGVVAESSLSVDLHSPAPGHAEADTAQWWSNVCTLIPSVLDSAGASPADVVAVTSTGMVPAVVCVGADGPTRRAILQNDARAVDELGELHHELAHLDLVRLTGSSLSQQSVAPTLRWLARHESSVWAATDHVAGSYDWLLEKLGARPHVELNWALESGMFDLSAEPVADVIAGADAAERLPAVVESGTTVGELTRDAADAVGLRPGTPLIVGGADHILSAVGAGLTRPGDLLVKLGGAGDIMLVADQPITDRRLYLDSYPVPDLWMPNGCMATSGSLIRWVQSLTGGADLAILDEEAEECPPGEVLCLPYFLGEKSPLHDPDLRGAFVGLHLGHRRGHLHRSVLEAIGFGFRHHVDVIRDIGCDLNRVWVSNGGSRSPTWKRIIADILGLPLLPVVGHPGGSLGAALVASVALGLVDGWEHTPGGGAQATAIPFDPDRHAHYDQVYEQWRALGEACTPISHTLARLSRT